MGVCNPEPTFDSYSNLLLGGAQAASPFRLALRQRRSAAASRTPDIVVMRYAAQARLLNTVFHWARSAPARTTQEQLSLRRFVQARSFPWLRVLSPGYRGLFPSFGCHDAVRVMYTPVCWSDGCVALPLLQRRCRAFNEGCRWLPFAAS